MTLPFGEGIGAAAHGKKSRCLGIWAVFRYTLILCRNLAVGNAVGPLEFLQIPAAPDQHDFAEFPGVQVFETRRLLSGADAGADHRLEAFPVIGALFLFSSEHSPAPPSGHFPYILSVS